MPRARIILLVLCMVVLSACDLGGQSAAPTATLPPPPPTSVAGGEITPIDPATLGVTAVIVKEHGEAELRNTPSTDPNATVFRVAGGTNLVPMEAVALAVPGANGLQFIGLFFKVSVPSPEGDIVGWLEGSQLNYAVSGRQTPRPTPTLSPNGAATATAVVQESGKDYSSLPLPYFNTIGTPDREAIGVDYVFLYEKPDAGSQVVGIVPARRGAVFLQARDNPGGEMIIRRGAAWHAGTWFHLQFGETRGWVVAEMLNIQYVQ